MGNKSKDENICFDKLECAEITYAEILRKYEDTLTGYATFRERSGNIIGFIGVILTLEFIAIGSVISNNELRINLTLMNLSTIFFFFSLVFAALAYHNITFKDFEADYYRKYANFNDRKAILEDITKKDEFYKNKRAQITQTTCIYNLGFV